MNSKLADIHVYWLRVIKVTCSNCGKILYIISNLAKLATPIREIVKWHLP